MKSRNVTAILFALIITVCSFSVFASAANDVVPATPAQIAEKMQEASFTSATGYVLNYRIYRSAAYSPAEMEKPAMLIMYFHEENGKGDLVNENGLLGLLLADGTEEKYKDFAYIIVAPQCPEGESFASITNSGKLPETESELLTAVKGLSAEIEATNIILEKHLVVGVGSGATGAFAYASGMMSKTSRLLTVGGECDASVTAQVYDAGVDFWCFAEKDNKSIKQLLTRIQSLCNTTPAIDFSGGAALEECVDYALAFDSPTVTEWLIKDAYTSRRFKVTANCTAGGKISAAPANVAYGSSASVTLTVEPGYIIVKADVNGNDIDIDDFKQIGSSRQYKYELKDVTEAKVVSVKLERFSNETAHGNLIDTLMITLSVISAVLVVAAVAVYLVSFMRNRPQEKK